MSIAVSQLSTEPTVSPMVVLSPTVEAISLVWPQVSAADRDLQPHRSSRTVTSMAVHPGAFLRTQARMASSATAANLPGGSHVRGKANLRRVLALHMPAAGPQPAGT